MGRFLCFCGPTVCATTGGTDSCSTKTSTTAHKNCGSLDVDMVVVWAVVDVFVGQLSVPPQVAQTVGPQRHQQRPTKTSTANTSSTAQGKHGHTMGICNFCSWNPQRYAYNCCCNDCCGSLNVDMVLVWAVVDVVASQLSQMLHSWMACSQASVVLERRTAHSVDNFLQQLRPATEAVQIMKPAMNLCGKKSHATKRSVAQ